jgi:hypothetical protein
MKLIFSDNQTVDLVLNDNPLTPVYQKIYKHLSSVLIPFRPWDNPYFCDHITYTEQVDNLISYAHKISIDIDRKKCLDQDQMYFNMIHKIYEQNYDGDPAWLDFHENIHLCEMYFMKRKNFLVIDYREKSGLLEKPMQPDWLMNVTTKITAGEIFVNWAELGKTPYSYWKNNEPNDIERICQLAKPWLKLRPKIHIALRDIDTLEDVQQDEFNHWWQQHRERWNAHWNLPAWDFDNMFGVSVLGNTPQLTLLNNQLKNNAVPLYVKLD